MTATGTELSPDQKQKVLDELQKIEGRLERIDGMLDFILRAKGLK